MPSSDYLDEERKKLWIAVRVLEEELKRKTSESEKEARQASKKASEYRNRCLDALNAAEASAARISTTANELKKNYDSVAITLKATEELNARAKEYCKNIEGLVSKTDDLEDIFENKAELIEKISNLESIVDAGQLQLNKINLLHQGSLKLRSEIGSIHTEVLGYEETNESGEVKKIPGLKDELENTYEELEKKAENLDEKMLVVQKLVQERLNELVSTQTRKLSELKDEWGERFVQLEGQITSLLPNALTAGLSSAFSEKRKAEIEEGIQSRNRFSIAILGLVVVSLLPFCVAAYLIIGTEKSLEEMLLEMPRLATAILPLYLPLLWLAYSSMKGVNLSKRLVEEYTHKEVLSKTYEGLSKQIDELGNEEISGELRVRLLYNILNVNSENPGKLISDYKNIDHPIMDALDKGLKFSNAVDDLSQIPGFGRIAKVLEKKSKKLQKNKLTSLDETIDDVVDDD